MTPPQLQVAVIVSEYPAASETFILRKVVALVEAGIDVSVIASTVGRTRDVPGRAHTVRRWRLSALMAGASAWGLAARALREYGVTARAVRAWLYALPLTARRIEIAHFEFSGVAVGYLDSLRLLPDLRVVVSCRGAAEQITPLVHAERSEQLAMVFGRADAIHAVSEDMSNTIQRYGAPAAKIVVNRPAIDPDFHRRHKAWRLSDPVELLSVGRLHWKKGFDVAITAVRALLDRGHRIRYRIVGEGREREKLLFMIWNLGLDEVVVLVGQRSPVEVKDLLERTTIFVLPSFSEGISNAALEAMAMEVPVVSTIAGGMTEVITDGVDGFLAPSFDADGLARAIERATSAADLREVGISGRRTIEAEYTIERQSRVFQEMYSGLRR